MIADKVVEFVGAWVGLQSNAAHAWPEYDVVDAWTHAVPFDLPPKLASEWLQ
jgi:hypothetical protein